jgi:hypothetical protein
MRSVQRFKKPIAAFLLLVFSASTFLPGTAYALTSGPEQPEMKGFQPIGINDMVDLFSGDFRYNLPLMDVGGYPLNLAYNSGQSLDDEASWVGFGWSLNPGTINRQLRGIPDDFNGKDPGGDVIEKQVAMKPFISRGIANPNIIFKRKGKRIPKTPGKFKVTVGLSHNNYTGVKADIGFNATLGQVNFLGTSATMNIGINSNNQDGGNFTGEVNFSGKSKEAWDQEFSLGGSIGFDYNATRGIEGLTLGASFDVKKDDAEKSYLNLSGNEFISFSGESYIPAVEIPQRTKTYSYTLRGGPTFFGFTGVIGISGSYSKQDIAPGDRTRFFPAYGMMNAVDGKNNVNAMMDFNRENDRPYHPKLPYLPVPVMNHDLFAVTSQNGSGQYKISTSSSGIVSDNSQKSKSQKFGFGLELGVGNVVHIGIPGLSYNQVTNKSGKWKDKNEYRTNGDFINTSVSNHLVPEAYFKKVGETSLNEGSFRNKIGDKEAVAVRLRDDGWAKTFGRGTAYNKLKSRSGKEYTSEVKKDAQDKRNETFAYLRAGEAQYYGLDKDILSYPMNSIIVKGCNDNTVLSIPRVDPAFGRRENHFSEITVTDQGGIRQVYGIPMYNMRQDEVSFSVLADENARKKGLMKYAPLEDSVPTSDGDPRMTSKSYIYNFNKQRLRGYATSYLLTGVLSPDYVDVTGNGISDDDLGTAVKFNYSKIGDYKWRTPFFNVNGSPDRVANYNEGLLSDKKDDKASYVYGEKEQWYMHSIESKTMLALFVLEDRLDGLGVTNSDGAVNSSFKLKRLKEIKLYAKADLYKNRNDLSLAIPIKVIHFEYSYELFSNVPNSLAGGKLVLKKMYTTFFKNGEGKLHPYTFNYNIPAYQDYQFRQYDRWGMYKPADSANRNGLTNAEFPYSTQDRVQADRWAGYWQLSQINLPTGGTININYESDDYAYVQDKRASAMCFIKGVGAMNQSTNIAKTNTIYVELPQAVANVQELKEKYFEGMEQLYFKSFMDMDNKNTNYEFIPGYAKIEKVEMENTTTAKVTVSRIDGYSPISKAAWQILKNNLPKLAYSEYDNLDSDESDFIKSLRAMISAISRIADIVRSFDTRANGKGFASRIDLNKSWVRLCSPDLKKIGGGSRVKKITMSDKWSEMTGSVNTESATYGQAFYYTTEKTLSTGQTLTISSGVASYEPQLGGDENPFKLPVQYTQKRFLGLDQHYYVEQPIGESYFPAASVGYSKVVVKNIGADNVEGNSGSTTTEFFTAKDFPTRVEATDLQRIQPKLRKIFRLFSIKLSDHSTVSQGYVIENFNMHGKQKSERIIDKNNQEISATVYQYRTDGRSSGKPSLNNLVPVMSKDGSVSQALIGVDYDFFTDMNEHSTESFGASGEPSGGFYFLGPFPRPWFYWGGFAPNYDKRLFRSAVAIKAINSFPILEKIIRVEKGSRIEMENVLWDGETGDVLLTKTQNEFDDPVYSFNYPAYWVYDAMGQACKNQGLYLTGFYATSDGLILNYGGGTLFPGDELIQIANNNPSEVKKYWIIMGADGLRRVVDENGIVTGVDNKTVKVLRSGRRNLSSSSIGTIVSLKNPIVANRLRIDALTQVTDAKAAVFNEEWSLPVKLRCTGGCPPGYIMAPGGFCYSGFQNPSGCTNYTLCAKSAGVYSVYGSRIFNAGFTLNGSGSVNTTFPPASPNNNFWKSYNSTANGPLNRCGVWSCTVDPGTARWIGVSRKITFPESKVYYIGIAADNFARLKIDGQILLQFAMDGSGNGINGEFYDVHFKWWNIYPVYLTAGAHFFEISGKNDGSIASFGCEIYNNTIPQITAATSEAALNILFTTKSLRTAPNNVTNFTDGGGCSTCPAGYSYNPDDNKCYYVAAGDPNAFVFNPYRSGILGNWHTQRSYVFDIPRTNLVADPAVTLGTNIRKSGYYNNFNPYWISNGTNFSANTSGGLFYKWLWGNEVTGFNTKGLETENKDAAGRYSAAQTAYLQTLPVAVGANTRLRDLAYDGFEDYDLSLQCSSDTCNIYQGHFNFLKLVNGSSIKADNAYAHTGNYSLKLNTAVTLNRSILPLIDTLYKRDDKQQYNLYSNFPMKGFSPSLPGQKYVVSFWVRDNNNSSVNPSVNVSVNGASVLTGASYKAPLIEGWKRVEAVFTMPSGVLNFDLGITPTTSTIYIDDIRIFPFDSQVKSYAYDVNTLRLMAELDENNLATFYEYDDEGVLIRVKKETEKGIVTVHETRTGVKRTN